MNLLSKFYQESPYKGFDPEEYPSDLQGWGSDDSIFRQIIEISRPQVIVEVGTWKGASALHMADIVKELGLNTKIICVDTWLGSPEHFLAKQPGWRESLLLKNGFPRLYFTFLSNVIRAGHQDCIIPLANTSDNAAVILKELGVYADMIYIDAAHEEDPAYKDFQNFWDILTCDGVLLGDDYMSWEGVTRAAHRFAVDVQRPLVGKWSKFVITRSDKIIPQIGFNVSQ
jgi:predicted O-methyltransferase YrrM